MKTIIRVKRLPGNFTIIPNKVLRDKMSLRAKGLLCMILSNVDEWVVTKSWVSQHCIEGRDALKSVFDELVELGYASVEGEKGEDGRFAHRIWTFRDQSNRDGKPGTETTHESAESQERKAAPENPSLQNTIEEDQLRNTSGDAAKERQSNPLFDALAEVCGMDTSCTTSGEWKKVGIAIAAICKAQPNVTTKDIAAHAMNYRKLFKDAVLTPLALSNHWGATASKSSLRGLSSQSGVHTPNDLQLIRDRISGHPANPRHSVHLRGRTLARWVQEEYDQLVARCAELSEDGK
jgi:hypothetical protein